MTETFNETITHNGEKMDVSISVSINSHDCTNSDGDLILDTIAGSHSAYSYSRRLKNDYTGDSFVIVNEDDVELGIGFNGSNNVDEPAMLAHRTGTGILKVKTAYDQSGNGNNWTQTDATKMPVIADASGLIKVNGRLAVDNNNGVAGLISSGTSNPALVTQFHVYKNTSVFSHSFRSSTSYSSFLGRSQNSNGTRDFNAGASVSHYLNSVLVAGNSSDGRDELFTAENASQCILSTINIDLSRAELSTLSTGDAGVPAKTYEQERIMFDSDKSGDRSEIEDNINNYYAIY